MLSSTNKRIRCFNTDAVADGKTAEFHRRRGAGTTVGDSAFSGPRRPLSKMCSAHQGQRTLRHLHVGIDCNTGFVYGRFRHFMFHHPPAQGGIQRRRCQPGLRTGAHNANGVRWIGGRSAGLPEIESAVFPAVMCCCGGFPVRATSDGATVDGRDSHPPGNGVFPRRTKTPRCPERKSNHIQTGRTAGQRLSG